jgi:hypothetical protein
MVVALFKPRVIVGAEPGQHRELFTAQARHPTPSSALDADVFGLDPFATSPEKLSQLMRTVHRRDPSYPPPTHRK